MGKSGQQFGKNEVQRDPSTNTHPRRGSGLIHRLPAVDSTALSCPDPAGIHLSQPQIYNLLLPSLLCSFEELLFPPCLAISGE